MNLYRLALCFFALLLLVGFVVADNRIVIAQGSSVAVIKSANATIQAMQPQVVIATAIPSSVSQKYTPPDYVPYIVLCCFTEWRIGIIQNKMDTGKIKAYIFVVGVNEDRYPIDEAEANKFVERGEGCYADSGSIFEITGNNPSNDRGLGVKLVTGNCKGIWWVDKEFLNFTHTNPQKQDLTSEEG